jgi:hypothetical protein
MQFPTVEECDFDNTAENVCAGVTLLKSALRTWCQEHRGKTSAHAPNYENMAGNLNINF